MYELRQSADYHKRQAALEARSRQTVFVVYATTTGGFIGVYAKLADVEGVLETNPDAAVYETDRVNEESHRIY